MKGEDIDIDTARVKGFSTRNIGRMVAFYRDYSDIELILPQPVAKPDSPAILPQAVAKLKTLIFSLLFYHLKLRCFIVIELKKGKFKPEYAGKLNFYCNVVDDKLRHKDDQPTIGLILCQDKNEFVAEYALKGIEKPIGISEYQLTKNLPKEFRSSLPSVEEIEAELGSVGEDE